MEAVTAILDCGWCCSCCHMAETGPLLEHFKWENLYWLPALRISLSGLLSQKSVKRHWWQAGSCRGKKHRPVSDPTYYVFQLLFFLSHPELTIPDMWVNVLPCMPSGRWTHLFPYFIWKTLMNIYYATHRDRDMREREKERWEVRGRVFSPWEELWLFCAVLYLHHSEQCLTPSKCLY